MAKFTKALDRHIDNKRIPYSYRDNSKTTHIRTALKEDQKKTSNIPKTCSLTHTCARRARAHNRVDLSEYFQIIHSIVHASIKLDDFSQHIHRQDPNLLDECNQLIKNVTSRIFDSLIHDHNVSIPNQVQSDEVFTSIISQIMPINDIKNDLMIISTDILKRLAKITSARTT